MSISSVGSSGNFDSAQFAKQFFKKADVNNDGSIDKSELKTMQANGPGGKNGSQDVDKEFEELDSDGDGKISESELSAQLSKKGAEGAPSSGGMPPSGGAAPSSSSSSTYTSKTYDKKDTNKDGTVSSAEELQYDMKHPEAVENNSGGQKTTGYTQSGNSDVETNESSGNLFSTTA